MQPEQRRLQRQVRPLRETKERPGRGQGLGLLLHPEGGEGVHPEQLAEAIAGRPGIEVRGR